MNDMYVLLLGAGDGESAAGYERPRLAHQITESRAEPQGCTSVSARSELCLVLYHLAANEFQAAWLSV